MSAKKTGKPAKPAKEKSGFGAVVFVVVALAAVCGGAYAAAWYFASDRVPRGTTVDGVRIGGQTHDEAVATLQDGLADRAEATFDVVVDGDRRRVTPEDAGLAVDYDATVDAAGAQRSWDPQWLWAYFTGGEQVDPVVTVDEATMADFLATTADGVAEPAKDGAVAFTRSGFRVTHPVEGAELDQDAAREALETAYLTDDPTVRLSVQTVQPDIDAADVEDAVDSFANPAMSGAVTLAFGKAQVRLQPRDYAPAISLEAEDGALVPTLDDAKLDALLGDLVVGGDGAPVDASFTVVDGKPRVVPAKPGVTYDPDEVHERFLDVVAAPEGERRLEVEATVAKPDFTTQDAKALGITERVSTFTTYYPHADYRNVNIGRAAELVDGTVLKPGETFSLNDIVGERTRENGFTDGYIISNGILVTDLGGGVSQMATTTFNAMFFAGLEDVEHKPHSFYIDRYPIGREATVAWGSVDLRFRNDTDHGVLIKASVTPSTWSSSGVVTVSMYSTKVWDITTSTSERYNLTSPKTRTIAKQECHPNTGYGGFDIDVFRYFHPVGSKETVKTEKFHTTYTPSDTVICTHPNPTG